MYKKLAELKVDTYADYYEKVVKALENAGFVIVLETETMSTKYFIVAEHEVMNGTSSTITEKEDDNE